MLASNYDNDKLSQENGPPPPIMNNHVLSNESVLQRYKNEESSLDDCQQIG